MVRNRQASPRDAGKLHRYDLALCHTARSGNESLAKAVELLESLSDRYPGVHRYRYLLSKNIHTAATNISTRPMIAMLTKGCRLSEIELSRLALCFAMALSRCLRWRRGQVGRSYATGVGSLPWDRKGY